jgi:proline iminopeptidase
MVRRLASIPPVRSSKAECAIVKVQERNRAYYSKFPEDVRRVTEILNYLTNTKVMLPGGGVLTPDRFLSLGIIFGMKGSYQVAQS